MGYSWMGGVIAGGGANWAGGVSTRVVIRWAGSSRGAGLSAALAVAELNRRGRRWWAGPPLVGGAGRGTPGSPPTPGAPRHRSRCVFQEELRPRALDIPMARLTVSYSRSSGPGGQNVNKVNSKAEVRFHLASADWIPEAVRQRMALMHRNRINRAGELIVTSEESRYQMRNLAICLEKIRTMVTEATEKPKVVSKETTQKLIERVEKMNRERLRQKKIHSTIKQSRKADFD
ncbi:peptidyl-tRNA hydrolase ICT1, mitochondrial isoform X1 [Pyrgilauda ruficollis]|uniref:peptidyl-tRNA hydrolase ICT1, mitochondrial isoform X1 n=1 Tax=Pyrgilauda ruficollis TaxID=221976 RepID=UPI001B86F136|nr:peptidyl-tRNA hydrolase ICT1, mitochondrial isoform X1 [Pyrgilauda ruficollis]